MYRPVNWQNPFPEMMEDESSGVLVPHDGHRWFEPGADAMLKELRAIGTPRVGYREKGTLVFIPD